MKNQLACIFGVQFINKDEQYLDASLFASSRLVASYKYLIEKMHSKLNGWKSSLQSHAGREVLVKFSSVAIPSFQMGVGPLPKETCHEMKGITRNFY